MNTYAELERKRESIVGLLHQRMGEAEQARDMLTKMKVEHEAFQRKFAEDLPLAYARKAAESAIPMNQQQLTRELLEYHVTGKAMRKGFNGEVAPEGVDAEVNKLWGELSDTDRMIAAVGELYQTLDRAGLAYLIEGYAGSVMKAGLRIRQRKAALGRG